MSTKTRFCTACGFDLAVVPGDQPQDRTMEPAGQRPAGSGGRKIRAAAILLLCGILCLAIMGMVVNSFASGTESSSPVPGTVSSLSPAVSPPATAVVPSPAATVLQTPVPRFTAGTSRVTQTVPQPDASEKIYREYRWTYLGSDWSWSGWFSRDGYEYYRAKLHTRENNYAEYALSDYDRTMLQNIVKNFREGGAGKGYTAAQNAMNVIAFVQSLPYTADKVTTGFDEYPRYPVETLVDNGGDCEDTSILAAALINEMGYGVVLLRFPGHMAIGIRGSDDSSGTYYEYKGSRYYYLETTGTGWDPGEIPEEYRNQKATVLPLVQVPRMDMTCMYQSTGYDLTSVYLHQHCDIRNIGVGTAKNPALNVAALALDEGEGMIWSPDANVSLDDYAEGATGYAEANLNVPRGKRTQIRYLLYGDNFAPVGLLTKEFST